jgi:hypothetical protein
MDAMSTMASKVPKKRVNLHDALDDELVGDIL